jgi:TatD DNase family protein
MTRYIDTHCHPYFDSFDADRDAVLDRAVADGAEAMVLVGVDGATNGRVIEIASKRPECFVALGFHPHSAHLAPADFDARIASAAAAFPKTVAVGEVGLDYFKSEASREVQIGVFDRAIDLAGKLDLPVVVHSRDAFADTMDRLEEGRRLHPRLKALFHCYAYGPQELERVLAAGFSVSFSGIVTFKNAAALQEAARRVPADRYVVETDAPYLAPVPHRGERNEPSWARLVAAKVAELRGETFEKVLSDTTRNAKAFFRLPSA